MASSLSPKSSSLHLDYLRKCLELASQSPPKPTNFRVGAVLVFRQPYSEPSEGQGEEELKYTDQTLSTGYTLELPGNTHAEQCCLAKLASERGFPEDEIGAFLEILHDYSHQGSEGVGEVVLYVTMEPCGKRLSGNTPCVQRIVDTRTATQKDGSKVKARGIDKVYFGVKEPGTFVGQSEGCKMLDAAGIKWEIVEGMEEEILKIATAGHQEKKDEDEKGTNVDDISPEERRRQEQMPRNPKKRMMEAPE